MSDLYSGLMQPYLRKGKNGEQFWGLYDPLDRVTIPDSSLFLQMQIKNLKNLESGEKYTATNEFLRESGALLQNHEATAENEIGDEVYSRILEIMNAGLKGSSLNPYKGQRGLTKAQQKQQTSENIKSLLQELTSLLQMTNTNATLSANIVSMLEKRLRNFNWGHTPHSYIMEKADLAEALMVDRMNQNPALRAIVTGSWLDLSGKQLIEDAFAFNKDSIDIPFEGGKLSFSVKVGKGKFKSGEAMSIKDFLDQIEALNGVDFKVQLSDELYEALKTGSTIAGQAKSGLHGQAILNQNKRNSMTLEEAGFDPRLLWDLYQADLETRTQFFKPETEQDSKDLEALANYCLSKNIAKTALAANQLYLTSEGFVTASQWMELNNRYLVAVSPKFGKVGDNIDVCLDNGTVIPCTIADSKGKDAKGIKI